jgi:sterol desaturase/sphingolipid hydroxylase (fatty acid hydroxylase superfamily)
MEYKNIFALNFGIDFLRVLALYVAATALALVIELFCVGRRNSTLFQLSKVKKLHSLRHDIYIWLLDISGIWLLIGKLLTIGITFYIAGTMNPWISSISPYKFLPEIPFLALQVVIYLLFADLIGYWLHRTFHVLKPFWHLHKFHHSATEMGVFTARRDNPLVVPFFVLFTELPFAFFGYPKSITLWVTFFAMLHAFVIHSKISSDWGWIGKWLVVSPYGHTIHHSKTDAHLDKNFAFMFPIWDHIFRTYSNGSAHPAILGIRDEPTPSTSVVRHLSIDIGTFLKSLLNLVGLARAKLP